jgi:hypothetical protein
VPVSRPTGTRTTSGAAARPTVWLGTHTPEALESLAAGRADAAFRLLVADGDRSWLGIMRMGATITAEAWNMGVKPNMDWNHSWGATA